MNQAIRIMSGAVALSAASCSVQGDRFYVDPNVAIPGDGSSWLNAVEDVQDALELAEQTLGSDEMWVAKGTYIPTVYIGGNDHAQFLLVDGTAMFGGFLGNAFPGGGETDLHQRDPENNLTIISGDIDGDDDFSHDCCSAHVAGGCSDSVCETLICDLYPKCCSGEWDVFCALAAAALCDDPCNTADNSWRIVMSNFDDSMTVFNGFTVTASLNTPSEGDGGAAGGMLVTFGSPLAVRCVFDRNVGAVGGGLYWITDDESVAPSIINCVFTRNAAETGAGMHVKGEGNSEATVEVVNCLFANNGAFHEASAFCALDDHHEALIEVKLTNCTFTGNTVQDAAGVIHFTGDGVTAKMTNCIVWGNSPSADQIVNDITGNGSLTVTFSDVEGGWAGAGNIDADPLFIDPDDGIYILQFASPAIDTGRTASLPLDVGDVDDDGNTSERLPLDLDLITRVIDGGLVEDASPPKVDMGAFESILQSNCPADLDGDSIVGTSDLLILLGAWGPCANCTSCPEDLTQDCLVGSSDLIQLLGAWGPCGHPIADGPPEDVTDCIQRWCCDPEDLPALEACLLLMTGG